MTATCSMYFEDFVVGQTFRSAGRTIGEADITLFSMLSGDWNALHSDAVFAAASPFGRRVAHGSLGIAIATGLLTRLGIFEETAIALLDFREWHFRAPIFSGDTLHLCMAIVAARPTKDPDRGVIDRHIQLVNQDSCIIQEGYSAILIAARSANEPLEVAR